MLHDIKQNMEEKDIILFKISAQAKFEMTSLKIHLDAFFNTLSYLILKSQLNYRHYYDSIKQKHVNT